MVRLEGWSLTGEEWQELAKALDGAEWQRTHLDSLYQDSVEPSAGIYLLVTDGEKVPTKYRLPKDIANVIYVGQSTNLKNRFTQHAAASQKNPLIRKGREIFGTLRFMYTLVPRVRDIQQQPWLDDVESALVKVLSPPANRTVPKGSSAKGKIGLPQPIGR